MPSSKKRRERPLPLPASLPNLHSLMSLAVAFVFDTLRVNAALREADEWYAIHVPSQAALFELAHGKGVDRNAYNERHIGRALKTKKTVLGTHAGFSDFFVPVQSEGHVHAVLVTGPFSTARPTSSEILERWNWISGRQGHPSDPEFAHYVSMTLSTLLLEGEQLGRFERLLQVFATMAAAQGDARALAAEAAALTAHLERARFVERVWEEARSMVDERAAGAWLSPHKESDVGYLGLSELPEHVLVGLLSGRPDEPDAVDPVEQVLARDAFQRACVELGQSVGNTIAGRVGDHGVMFLVSSRGRGTRARRFMTDLGNRVAQLARRRLGLTLHLGVSALTGSASPLCVRYEEALAAAEQALLQGVRSVDATPNAKPKASPIRYLREELGTAASEQPGALVSKFERFVELVTIHSGYRFELVRSQLEAGFVQVAHELRAAGALDSKGYHDLLDTLDGEARTAPSVSALVAAYRRAMGDLVRTAEHPVVAAQDRSLQRALTFMHRHYAEPISLPQVARVAGFAPSYFSHLFKAREKVTFEHYVQHLRIERAKQLLSATSLGTERIADLSGFRFRPYFHRVFKQAVGRTPTEFRRGKARAARA